MLLSQFFQRMAYGPISDLVIGGENTGVIPVESKPRLVSHLNEALTTLHTRFALIKGTLELRLEAGRFIYPLRKDYALFGGVIDGVTPSDNFIVDTPLNPFDGSLLKVDRVSTLFDGQHIEVRLNERGNPDSWFLPQFDVLSMAFPGEGQICFVDYRADHPRITPDEGDAQIQLPPSLEQALLDRVAHLVYKSQNSEVALLKANELLQSYDRECGVTEIIGAAGESEVDFRDQMFRRGGWI